MSSAGILAERSLRSKQLDAVLKMLNLNSKPSHEITAIQQPRTITSSEWVWKVLIYDQFGQEIIAPLLRISDLRENGVTLHLLLNSDRQKIPDVPAVYFVEPTHENVARICQDMEQGLYENYYINFSSVVPRDLLEYLAQSTLQSGTYEQISQVFDQYLNYLCLETCMFSLNLKDSYLKLNQPNASDSQIEWYMRQIVDRLFSVFITTGQVPVIRAPRGNAAENVALSLETRLRDHVRNAKNEAFVDQNGLPTSRPLLIVIDRNMDLGTMLHHTWSYQCLAHDIFDMKANRISYPAIENGKSVKKVYDLELNDFFWAKNASSPFPQMAADVDEELNKYKSEVEEITRKCGVQSLEELGHSDPSTSALHLKAAISSLPALTEKKRTIDMHMNIATALLKEIKERSLDAFIVTEESINKQTKSSMLETITNKTKGSPEDKLRCFILFYLNSDSEISKADMNEYEMALTNSGCDLASLRYLKQIKSIIQMTNTSQLLPSSANKGVLGRFSSTLADNLNATGFGGALDTLISGVKNILPTRQNLPILRIVNSLCETGGGLSANLTQIGGGGGSNPDEEYLYLDPMMPQAKKPPRGAAKAVFQDIFVFVVGGGNYVEYQNLQEYSKVQLSGKRIIYGSTEICNAASFLSQLGTLGGSGTKA